jgi:hypothetical protein
MSHPDPRHDPRDRVHTEDHPRSPVRDPHVTVWPDSLIISELRALRPQLRTPLKILIYKLTQTQGVWSEKAAILEQAAGALISLEDAYYDAQSAEDEGYLHEGEDYAP